MTRKQPKGTARPGVDEYGRVPAHYAANEGDESSVKAFLEGSGSPDVLDDNGWTLLHFAAQGRHIDIARLLLRSGANPNLVDAHGNGPLWTAIMNARGGTELIAMLVQAGADTDRRNARGKSPRDMANTIGHGLEKAIEP